MTEKKLIEYRSVESEKGVKNRALLKALREGEEEMRRLAEVYLPSEKNEDPQDYQYRLKNKTSLYSGTQKSIEDINNRIFSKEVRFECEDEEIRELVTKNITGSGDGLNEFSKKYNLDGIWNGVSFSVVNFNTGQVIDTNPNVITIDPDNVLDMRPNDKGDIVLFKFQSEVVESVDLFTTEEVKYIYLYYVDVKTVKLKTFRITKEMKDYEELPEITLPPQFTKMPIVGLFPETREKNLNADRPYLTMAFKNRVHWIYNSIYINLVDIASRPFLFGTSINKDKDTIKFGIKTMFLSSSEKATMTWIQADPKSAEMMRTFLEDLKDEMQMLGSEFLSVKQTMTATQAVINTSDTSSKASGFAQNLEDALIKIVEIMLLWKKKESTEFKLTVNKNVGITKDRESFDIINALNDKNVISNKDLRSLSSAIGYLPVDLSEDDYLKNLEDEGKLLNVSFVSEEIEDEEVKEEI